MQTVAAKPALGVRVRISWAAGLRPGEKIALAYFTYVAGMGFLWPLPAASRLLLCAIPFVFWGIAAFESRCSQTWSAITRDWVSLSLILVAYWELNLFQSPPMTAAQNIWVGWDRTLLENFGIRAAIEAGGGLLPGMLETVYLCLYAIPPVCMAILYFQRQRRCIDRFLLTLFLGTFTAYALLPHFSSISPRIAFPGLDAPAFLGWARTANTWVLDHLDISTSVFPSGHVAVAFSSAFGLLHVMPHRRAIWAAGFGVATLVYIATIYGRYHYAVDGLASIAVAFITAQISSRWSASE
jgi:membrane-associated phospholipid phosphatase